MLNRLAGQAGQVLPRVDKIAASGPCVRVDFLTRYPIRAVLDADSRQIASDGILTRRYRVKLENGQTVELNAAPAAGEIMLEQSSRSVRFPGAVNDASRPSLSGRFTLNEYIGRVIDREADARSTQAAQALAVTARTYLLQNASFEAGCYRIADDSRTQRVSMNPASRSARAAALATDELILSGTAVRYHRDQATKGVMSWQAAQAQSERGLSFTAILRENWPDASLMVMDANSQCRPIAEAQIFMATAMTRWQRLLVREPGFEMPPSLRICTLDFGHPYVDLRRSSIYLRQWQTYEGRLTLAHEFIHLAFARHPNGSDELFAERWARVLINSLAVPQVSVSSR